MGNITYEIGGQSSGDVERVSTLVGTRGGRPQSPRTFIIKNGDILFSRKKEYIYNNTIGFICGTQINFVLERQGPVCGLTGPQRKVGVHSRRCSSREPDGTRKCKVGRGGRRTHRKRVEKPVRVPCGVSRVCQLSSRAVVEERKKKNLRT